MDWLEEARRDLGGYVLAGKPFETSLPHLVMFKLIRVVINYNSSMLSS